MINGDLTVLSSLRQQGETFAKRLIEFTVQILSEQILSIKDTFLEQTKTYLWPFNLKTDQILFYFLLHQTALTLIKSNAIRSSQKCCRSGQFWLNKFITNIQHELAFGSEDVAFTLICFVLDSGRKPESAKKTHTDLCPCKLQHGRPELGSDLLTPAGPCRPGAQHWQKVIQQNHDDNQWTHGISLVI